MPNNYILILGNDLVENAQVMFRAWRKGYKVSVFYPGIPSKLGSFFRKLPGGKKYFEQSVSILPSVGAKTIGLWYDLSEETMRVLDLYYKQHSPDYDYFITRYNRIYQTNKVEAFVKKQMSRQIFAVLKHLHLLKRDFLEEPTLVMVRTPLNDFVTQYFMEHYGLKVRIEFINSHASFLLLGMYYGKMILNFVRRGFVLNQQRKKFLFIKESVTGFERKYLNDDFFVESSKIKKEDVLFYALEDQSEGRNLALRNAQEKGYQTARLRMLKININQNFLKIVSRYFLTPAVTFLGYALKNKTFMLSDTLLFHNRAFYFENFMNHFDGKVHLSHSDHDDVILTIVLNKYGTKNVIVNWSDLTAYQDPVLSFAAHNVYMSWGDNTFNVYGHTFYVDEKVKIGCVYKAGCRFSPEERQQLRGNITGHSFQGKIITFFDTSFSNDSNIPEEIYINYLSVILEYAQKHPEDVIVLKPKSCKPWDMVLSADMPRLNKITDALKLLKNFVVVDTLYPFENILGLSDVSINMSINTPATIALICGYDAFYYDQTGNCQHLLANKYFNQIVFDDKDKLFAQIDAVLAGKVRCKDIISKQDIRSFDAYDDDKAIDRMKDYIYQLAGIN
ncbi:MAG: hypothetical protein HQL26_07720 [Candidatus Omnitrophica bacterium]|nr:hypothetical protein [Candidatus Omnitrophota bacterium]